MNKKKLICIRCETDFEIEYDKKLNNPRYCPFCGIENRLKEVKEEAE